MLTRLLLVQCTACHRFFVQQCLKSAMREAFAIWKLKKWKIFIILYLFNSRIFLNFSSFGFQDFSLCCQLLLYELDNLSAVFKTLPFPAYTYALGDFTQDHVLKNISCIDHYQLPSFYIQLTGHLCWLTG